MGSVKGHVVEEGKEEEEEGVPLKGGLINEKLGSPLFGLPWMIVAKLLLMVISDDSADSADQADHG